MEFALSAVTGDLCSRFISYLANKCTDGRSSSPEDKLQRLQQLLARLHTVVEEAEGRYITNSQMLVQLRTITQAMYRGYHVLHSASRQNIQPQQRQQQVSSGWFSVTRAKRSRGTADSSTVASHDMQSVLGSLETTIADMKEFVIFLGGCERMCRRPYDTYLYTDNFMFGRAVEKQKIINVLLQDDDPTNGSAAPLVLPVIGGCLVGKKTLVACACDDSKIRSYFSSVLHLGGDDIWRVERRMFSSSIKTLVVIEFVSDITDEEWEGFYSSVAAWMRRGSKIVIISRIQRLSRFATAMPIYLHTMSPDEYVYLFKVLAFGSADPEYHPQLAAIAHELGTLLGGLLLSANVLADMLRKNLDLQFWIHIFTRFRKVVDSNFSVFGAHPRALQEKDRPVDITRFSQKLSSPLRMMTPRSCRTDICAREAVLSSVTYGGLVAGSCAALPLEKFEVMLWESRIPPFTKFVATCVEEKVERAAFTGRDKRRRE